MLSVLGMTLFGIMIILLPVAGNFWQILTLLLTQGMVTSIYVSSSNALTVEEGRKFGMGSTMSVLFLAMGIGMGIGPILAGWIEGMLNVDAVFYYGGTVCLIGTGLFVWLTRHYKDEQSYGLRRDDFKLVDKT